MPTTWPKRQGINVCQVIFKKYGNSPMIEAIKEEWASQKNWSMSGFTNHRGDGIVSFVSTHGSYERPILNEGNWEWDIARRLTKVVQPLLDPQRVLLPRWYVELVEFVPLSERRSVIEVPARPARFGSREVIMPSVNIKINVEVSISA